MTNNSLPRKKKKVLLGSKTKEGHIFSANREISFIWGRFLPKPSPDVHYLTRPKIPGPVNGFGTLMPCKNEIRVRISLPRQRYSSKSKENMAKHSKKYKKYTPADHESKITIQ